MRGIGYSCLLGLVVGIQACSNVIFYQGKYCIAMEINKACLELINLWDKNFYILMSHESKIYSCLCPLHSADYMGVDPREQGQCEDMFVTQSQNKHCFYVT